MVSARGRKQSQRRRQPQQRRRPKSHARRPPSKPRKARGKAKRKPTEPQKKAAAKGSFDPLGAKALSQIKRGGKLLSREAKGLMVSFLHDVYQQVSKEADRLRRESRHPVAGPSHVQAALRRVMPKRFRQATSVAARSGH
ncbi:Histone h2b-like [Aix galericulata]|nr:Histone h2b-like [Aix galericulata]